MSSIKRKTVVNGQEVLYDVRDPNHAASVRLCHTGGVPAITTTQGTDTTPSTTETYFAEVYVPEPMTLNGIALLNGSAVAGNVSTMLYRATGSLVAGSLSAATAQSGTAAYQAFDCATAGIALLAGTYYVAVQFSSASARFRSHLLGAFGAGKQTSTVAGTAPSGVVPPTTFTTNLGPIASLY